MVTNSDNIPVQDRLNDLIKSGNYKKGGSLSYWEDYYSGCDVGVFIGSIWVDDIVTMQYSETNNKSPMYGYMSEKFDAVAAGTRVIQGQFAIAFRKVGYLNEILDNYRREKRFNPTKASDYWTKYYKANEKKYNGEELTKEDLLYDKRFVDPVDRFGYEPDDVHGGWINSDGFNIIVTFGDIQAQSRSGTFEVIDSVHITSKSLICEPGGDPIAEMYSFFGKSMNATHSNFNFVDNIAQADTQNQIDKANQVSSGQIIHQNPSTSPIVSVEDVVTLNKMEEEYHVEDSSGNTRSR